MCLNIACSITLHAMQVTVYFNYVTKLCDSIYVRLLCESGKKAACLHEGDYAVSRAITHAQMDVQSKTGICVMALHNKLPEQTTDWSMQGWYIRCGRSSHEVAHLRTWHKHTVTHQMKNYQSSLLLCHARLIHV